MDRVNSMYHALITAGGVGERFWPLSRTDRPKQLLKLTENRSMIRLTIDRLLPAFPPERIWIITTEALAPAISLELPDLPADHILCEPMARSTAAAIGLAALHIRRVDSDASMVVQAADHAIQGDLAFRKMLEVAEAHARATGNLVTCGFPPSRVGVGFGHIELGDALETRDGLPLYRVARFIEKPPFADAERYTASGRHLWNSGIFIWTLADLWTAFRRFMPELLEALEHLGPTLATPEADETLRTLYSRLPSIAIEYGVLERASNLAVIPGQFHWEDIGTWEGLRTVIPVNESGNVVRGDVITLDVQDSTLFCEDGQLGVIGVHGMVVVKSGDCVLVCPRERAGEIRAMLTAHRESLRLKSRL